MSPFPPESLKVIYEAVAAGRQIEAVRAYQDATGVTLEEATAYVEELARVVPVRAGEPVYAPPAGAPSPPLAPTAMQTPMPPAPALEAAFPGISGAVHPRVLQLSLENTQRIIGFVQAGQKVQAVSYLRQQTGLGLKDAADVVSALEKRVGDPGFPLRPDSQNFPTFAAWAAVPRLVTSPASFGIVALVAFLIAAVVAIFLAGVAPPPQMP